MRDNAELWAKGIAALVRDHVERATADQRQGLAETQSEVSTLRQQEPPDAFVERLANALTARLIA